VTKLVNDGVGNGTLATIRQLLSKIFNQAHAEGLIPRKITPDLNFPKERPSKLSKKTVKGWQDAIQPLAGAIEPRYQPAFYLAAILGLRAGEIGGLRVEDVDYTENEIEVKQAVRTVKGRAQLADTKTEQGERTIPVPSYLMDAITTHMREFPPASDGRIFTAPLAEPNYVSHLTLNKAFQKAIKATGLPPMRFHDLRHLAISTMLMLGIQPNVVKERAGHRTLAITMDRYGHLLPEQDRDAADKLENYLLTKGVMSVALPEVSVS
jgi:integrase